MENTLIYIQVCLIVFKNLTKHIYLQDTIHIQLSLTLKALITTTTDDTLSLNYFQRKHSWLKGSIFLKNGQFIIQERFNKLIYGINTIIKCGT